MNNHQHIVVVFSVMKRKAQVVTPSKIQIGEAINIVDHSRQMVRDLTTVEELQKEEEDVSGGAIKKGHKVKMMSNSIQLAITVRNPYVQKHEIR